MRFLSSTTATSSVECSTSERKRRSLRSSCTRARLEKNDDSMSAASSAPPTSVSVRCWWALCVLLRALSRGSWASVSAAVATGSRVLVPSALGTSATMAATCGSPRAPSTSGVSSDFMRPRLAFACALIAALAPWLAVTASWRARLSRVAAANDWARDGAGVAVLASPASLRTVSAANSTTITTSAGTSHWKGPDSPPGAIRAAEATRTCCARRPRRIPLVIDRAGWRLRSERVHAARKRQGSAARSAPAAWIPRLALAVALGVADAGGAAQADRCRRHGDHHERARALVRDKGQHQYEHEPGDQPGEV